MKKYKSKQFLSNEDAQIIGVFIEEISLNGKITPRDLVIAAKPKKSPIHKFFDWNDSSAAEKWRIHQARMIIGNLVVEIEEDQDVKAFFNYTVDENEEKERSYYSFDAAKANENIWNSVIESSLKELEHWQAKYKLYKELKSVYLAIETNKQKIRRKYAS